MIIDDTKDIGPALPERIRALLQSRDGQEIEDAITQMVRERENALFIALGQLARDLHESVKNVASALAEESGEPGGMPEARKRLDEALDLSERAAHHSLDIGDRLLAQTDLLAARATASERVAGADDALREAVLAFATSCRGDISELRVAQGWQDLTGQRMKQVSGFLSRIEVSVLSLVQLAGSLGVSEPRAVPAARGDASTQEQVDDLLAQFGF
ncbi:MAG: protein phosphatase CheZ [Xanthomonadaceae bacterium]|nr:protein phosphatase CheZ [Xanthomonadaceae bacterium]MDP2185550.1 protein phosphatase CheZ [Xanthomonadales bacterium]MDZ4115239.1 protein phosphatase CheZ [Xanthomonadaceae bacterium]MDZ4377602.1 protein phosphatase CheZ [Xanthomonadaceae bacterium]